MFSHLEANAQVMFFIEFDYFFEIYLAEIFHGNLQQRPLDPGPVQPLDFSNPFFLQSG